MIAKAMGEGEVARLSLMGEIRPVEEPDSGLVARYLRYHPHAERFLQLGDFRFYRLEPLRLMTVGGFAKASWLDGERLLDAPSISLAQEQSLLDAVGECLSDTACVLGVDAYGADVQASAERTRIPFAIGPVATDALLPTLMREFEQRGFVRRKTESGALQLPAS